MNYLSWSVVSVATLALFSALTACSSPQTPPAPESNIAEIDVAETPQSSPSLSSGKVTISQIPKWAKILPLPEYPAARDEETRNGIEYLLTDNQYKYDPGGYAYVSRIAFQVSDRKGLEAAAQIKRSFDPRLSELTFNAVNVTRDGKISDRLPQLEIREIQQESGLGSGIIDGDITALINLEDIRVGDIIDYTFSGRVSTPLYPDMFFDSASSSYSVPIARSHLSYDMPRNTRLYSELIKTKVRPKITDEDDRTIYSFDLINPDPHRDFSNIPDGIITKGSFQVSTEDSWSEIVDWALGVYAIDLTLPKSAKAEIKAIRKAHKSDSDRALAALQWVQDEIRYLGFEEGVNGHKPRTPAATIANGYGDCKDKSVLLQTALSEMGITSYVTLVNSQTGELLDQVLPAITMFDHAIVMAELDGRNVFFDPTGTYQRGGLDQYAEPDFGFVLPIKEGQSDLLEVEIPLEAFPLQKISEQYTYKDDGSIELEIQSYYEKSDADSMRRKVAQQGIAKLTQTYHEYYAERYPGLELLNNISVKDDERNNELNISEAYSLSADIVKSAKYDEAIEVKAYSISDKLPDFVEPARDFPLALRRGVKLKHEIHIVTPGRHFPNQDDETETVEGVDFKLDFQANDDTFSMIYDLSILDDRVNLSQANAMVELAERVENLASRNVNLKFARTPLYVRLGLNNPIEPDMLAEVQEIARLINEKENIDAVERVRKLSKSYKKQDALRGFIQQMQAAILIDLDRDNAAIPLLDEAFSLFDPLDQGIYFRYAGLQFGKDDFKGAANTMQRVFENHPKSATSLRTEWLWGLYRDLKKEEEHDEADNLIISLANAQLENLDEIDSIDQVFGTAVLAMGRQGQVEQAKALYPHLHDASTYRNILMNREMEPLWEDTAKLAGEGLAKARQAEVDHALEIATSDEASYLDFVMLISAYEGNGQMKEAIEFAKPIFENWDRLVAEGEDGFWFANAYASVLNNQGDFEESDRVYEKLMSIGVEQENSLVSMALNQMVTLVGRGDFKAALEKLDAYEAGDDFHASDYGMTFFWYAKACSQFQMGQREEAESTYKEKLLPIVEDNLAIKTLTLTCMEKEDEVAESLIERLTNKTNRPGTISIFVTDTVAIHPGSFLNSQSEKIREIANRPEVQKVFKTYGRTISVTGPSEVWAEF